MIQESTTNAQAEKKQLAQTKNILAEFLQKGETPIEKIKNVPKEALIEAFKKYVLEEINLSGLEIDLEKSQVSIKSDRFPFSMRINLYKKISPDSYEDDNITDGPIIMNYGEKNGKLYAEHYAFSLEPQYQQLGFGTEFFNKRMQFHKMLGCERLHILGASAEDSFGSVVWAKDKYGLKFVEDEPTYPSDELFDKWINEDKRSFTVYKFYDEVQKMLEENKVTDLDTSWRQLKERGISPDVLDKIKDLADYMHFNIDDNTSLKKILSRANIGKSYRKEEKEKIKQEFKNKNYPNNPAIYPEPFLYFVGTLYGEIKYYKDISEEKKEDKKVV